MPSNSESLPTHSSQDFCLALKAARERKGVALSQIADATKVPAFMFAALERNDLRRWPKGLFRRSFFRGYAGMIGVPVPEACAAFARLFPDGESAPPAAVASAATDANQADDVRLALDAAWHGPPASMAPRLLSATLDASIVIALSALAWVAGMDWPATGAIVALAYFSIGTVVFNGSPAGWAISERHSIADAMEHGAGAIALPWKHGVDAMSHVLGDAAHSPHDPAHEPQLRTWITDAHRVGPAPRFRVRIKVPQ